MQLKRRKTAWRAVCSGGKHMTAPPDRVRRPSRARGTKPNQESRNILDPRHPSGTNILTPQAEPLNACFETRRVSPAAPAKSVRSTPCGGDKVSATRPPTTTTITTTTTTIPLVVEHG